MTKKKAEVKKKSQSSRTNLLTVLAIVVGALLLLAGVAIVIIKAADVPEEPSCCSPRPRPNDPAPYVPMDMKPVLYLYPEWETEVTVKFAKPEYLTTTYPKYVDGWTVIAQPNGDLLDMNGKYYYGLYWEEKLPTKEITDGFYVDKENAIPFLEEKLSTIGLNDRERNEFIMYWLPILEQNEKSIVHFDLTEERQADNAIMITPAPDSLLRINMYVKKVDENPGLPEQELGGFERRGFTVVEWGGTKVEQ